MANAIPDQDERIAKRASSGEARADRVAQERQQTEDRGSTDAVRREERFAALKDVNIKLPTPPEMPGWHLCWLTTTNQSDTLEWRFRVGYELVKREEIPGFAVGSQQLGIPMMSISHSDLMPISSERSDAGLSQCETVIDISQEFSLFP